MMRSRALFSALAICATLPALAQSVDENGQGMGACFKLAEGEETDCVIETFQAADDELNIVYAAVLEISDPIGESTQVHVQRLRAAQRSWVQFRDLACLSEAGPPQVSMHMNPPVNYEHFFCLHRLTQHRINDLMLLGALN